MQNGIRKLGAVAYIVLMCCFKVSLNLPWYSHWLHLYMLLFSSALQWYTRRDVDWELVASWCKEAWLGSLLLVQQPTSHVREPSRSGTHSGTHSGTRSGTHSETLGHKVEHHETHVSRRQDAKYANWEMPSSCPTTPKCWYTSIHTAESSHREGTREGTWESEWDTWA